AANGAGYMIGNILGGSEFESVDFSIAATTGAVSGALGPVVGTTTLGASALGAVTGFAQYQATYYAHNKKFIMDDGAVYSILTGAVGGAAAGKYDSVDSVYNTSISSNGSIKGFNPNYGTNYALEHFTLAYQRNIWKNLPRLVTGGIISNLPI